MGARRFEPRAVLAATLGLLLAAGSLTVAAAPATAAPGSVTIAVSARGPDPQGMVAGDGLPMQGLSEITLAIDPISPVPVNTGLRGAWMLAAGMAVLALASGVLLLVAAGRMRRRRGQQLELTFERNETTPRRKRA